MRHVALTCKHHPELRWSCKSIAYNYPTGGYNGLRNIFFNLFHIPGHEECKCPASDLVLAPEEVWDSSCEN